MAESLICFLGVCVLDGNRVRMRRTTGGHHGWSHCWRRASLSNARYMLILTKVSVTCTVWIVWMALSAPYAWPITETTVLFRFVDYQLIQIVLFFPFLVKFNFEFWYVFRFVNGFRLIFFFSVIFSLLKKLSVFRFWVSSLFWHFGIYLNLFNFLIELVIRSSGSSSLCTLFSKWWLHQDQWISDDQFSIFFPLPCIFSAPKQKIFPLSKYKFQFFPKDSLIIITCTSLFSTKAAQMS